MAAVPLMTKVRALACAAMLLGFYAVGFVLLGSLVWLVVQAWRAFGGGIAQDVTYAAVTVAVALALPAWQIIRAKPQDHEGVRLTEEQAPALWATVRELSDALDTRMPDEIRLTADVNAAVSEDTGRVGLGRGRRYLYLGVPLLSAMTVAQVRSVIAHELGHYVNGHTVVGAVAYRGGQGILRTVSTIGPQRFAGLLFSAYAYVYFLVALAVMRTMEIEADASAARIAGPRATRAALSATPRLVTAWTSSLERYVEVARGRALAPDELLDMFIASISEATPDPDITRSRWDSHPSIADRLHLLPTDVLEPDDDPRPGLVLVDDRRAAWAALTSDAFVAVVSSIAQAAAERTADEIYVAAIDLIGRKRIGLGSVLDILAGGRGDDLVLARPLVDHVRAAVDAELVAAGHARWEVRGLDSLTVVDADGQPLLLGPLVMRACTDPDAVAPLRINLQALGLDETLTAAWNAPGRSALDPGPLYRTLPGTEPDEPGPLLLPDELLLLFGSVRHRHRLNTDVRQACLAAATIAELRIRHRVELVDGERAIVRVCNAAPTGNRFLDSVLARMDTGGSEPAYRWLQLIGPDIGEAVEARIYHLGRRWGYDANGRFVLEYLADRETAIAAARQGIVHALRTGESESHSAVLGMLLWGAELATPVLGWTSVGPRFWLGRMASRDPLMRAIRVVIGLYMPMPAGGTYASGN